MIEVRDLEYFLAVLAEGGVSRAALRLHVAQPTLSHALSRLEREVAERLLTRPLNRRLPMRATPAGRAFALRARRALAEIASVADDIAAVSGLVRGELRIGSIQSLNVTLLPPALAAFASAHPEVSLTLRTYPTERVAAAVLDGEVDVAVLAGPVEAPRGVLIEELFREELVAVARTSLRPPLPRRITLSRLAERSLVLLPRGSYAGDAIRAACAEAGFKPRMVLEVDSAEAARETVRSGLGITVLPEGYVRSSDQGLTSIRIERPTLARTVSLATPDGWQLPAAAAAFAADLRVIGAQRSR